MGHVAKICDTGIPTTCKQGFTVNWLTLPPIAALRAFAAYAETGSVAAAGAALNVSHAAISQQLRALESHMGVALLDRSARQMALTPEGAALARTLGEAFGRISETVEALTGAEEARPLHIACTPSFAASWLMPRLSGFRADVPGLELVIQPSPALTDPAPGGIDVALRYGCGHWPGLESEPLLPASLVVVGAPALFPDGPPETPEALARVPWLQELGTTEATRWLERHGVIRDRRGTVVHVPGNLMLDGVRQGQGVAVMTRLSVAAELAAGQVLAMFEDTGDAGYHIVTRPGVQRPPLRAFLRWLRREAAKT